MKFVSEIISVKKDANNKIIEGNPTESKLLLITGNSQRMF